MRSRETSAETLIKTLRELPNKEALALRSEVAMQVGCCAMRSVSGYWGLVSEQSLIIQHFPFPACDLPAHLPGCQAFARSAAGAECCSQVAEAAA